eukprot:15324847-Alexandrium_andersonii.AAC.1
MPAQTMGAQIWESRSRGASARRGNGQPAPQPPAQASPPAPPAKAAPEVPAGALRPPKAFRAENSIMVARDNL